MRQKLRKDELAEILGLGWTEQQLDFAMQDLLLRSVQAKAATLDGELAVLAGITGSLMDREWGGWLLTTDLVTRHPFEVVRRCRKELTSMAMGKPVAGRCADFYTQGLRFLQMVGFKIVGEFVAQTGLTYRELRFE
jgi:hypothetical protein